MRVELELGPIGTSQQCTDPTPTGLNAESQELELISPNLHREFN